MIGATPATLTNSGCTTPSAMPRRDAGVDRIAARLQNLEAGFGGEILGGGDHVARAHDGRAMGFHILFSPCAKACCLGEMGRSAIPSPRIEDGINPGTRQGARACRMPVGHAPELISDARFVVPVP